jgi:hypothetical protein
MTILNPSKNSHHVSLVPIMIHSLPLITSSQEAFEIEI